MGAIVNRTEDIFRRSAVRGESQSGKTGKLWLIHDVVLVEREEKETMSRATFNLSGSDQDVGKSFLRVT